MTRIYELTFIVDPRLSDEEVVSLSDDYKKMITEAGGQVVKEESWGKRRLAYPIQKVNEGRYVLLYVTSDGQNPMLEVERRMRQNDKVLRFLTVRTDRPVEIPEPAGDGEAEAEAASEEA